MSFNAPALTTVVERVRHELRSDISILVGGHALSWATGLSDVLGVHRCGPQASALVATVRDLLQILPLAPSAQ